MKSWVSLVSFKASLFMVTSAAFAEDVAHEAATPEKKLGFPQLDVSTYPSQIFWLVISFGILYFLMSRIALPRLTTVIETRNTYLHGNLTRADELKTQSERLRKEYERSLEKAQRAAADALSSASRAISEKTSQEQSRFAENSRKRLTNAEQNINKAKADALNSLVDISAEIAADIVQKIADVKVDKADAKKAVNSVMQKG